MKLKPFAWKQKRIYIFPNKFGFIGFATFIVMILAGATYQNNLVYMMAFLYLGLGMIAILQTARNLRDFEVTSVRIAPAPPDTDTAWDVWTLNTAAEPKYDLRFRVDLTEGEFPGSYEKIRGNSTSTTSGLLHTPKSRGLYPVRRIRVMTTFPYAMFNAWTYTKRDAHVAVYPAPRNYIQNENNQKQNQDEFSHHRSYVPGDSPARVDWKVYSRRGEMFVKEFSAATDEEADIDFSKIPLPDTESKLSQMAFWATEALHANRSFQIQLPNFRSGFGRGQQHFDACMEKLAGWQE